MPRSNLRVFHNMFRSLVHDESEPSSHVESQVDDRTVKYLLDMDDHDIILDLRKLNGKPSSSTFDVFWLELHQYLEVIGPAVQERRHGEAMYMPVAISENHVREIISNFFPLEEIPSLEWTRLQFLPRNPYEITALRYTGKFNVKYAVQCRQLRHEHQILCYAKEFAIFSTYPQEACNSFFLRPDKTLYWSAFLSICTCVWCFNANLFAFHMQRNYTKADKDVVLKL